MAKIKELSMFIEMLRQYADGLIDMADNLQRMFQNVPAAVKPDKPITMENVRAVLAEKSRLGFTADVKALLEKHGADRLSAVNPEEYPSLMKEAEVIGNAK